MLIAKRMVSEADCPQLPMQGASRTRSLSVATVDAAAMRTRYDYDPVGNLTKVTDSELNQIVNTYNIRGHKVTTNDPDMGVWAYKYNVLGELIEQKDARLQVSSFVYDKLGRMTRRTEGTDISTWDYDLAVNGNGKLAKETSTNGFARGYTYDGLSRPRTTTTTLSGVAYTSSDPSSRACGWWRTNPI